ncbi:hypothetical protein [Pseudoduganella rhizocola]|uniref:hypothetical protein n=1 Tax=Pseudoduganella rhizocola TaxID=3382643 RepID=UPI0038B53BD4
MLNQSKFLLLTLACAAFLAGCGGQDPDGEASPGPSAAKEGSAEAREPAAPSAQVLGESAPRVAAAAVPYTATVTQVKLVSTSNAPQYTVPVTFAQVFRQGDIPAGSTVKGRLEDGSPVNLQVEIKALHADKSLRHAIVSALVPNLAASQTRTLDLIRGPVTPAGMPIDPSVPLQKGLKASVFATIGRVRYSASAEQLLREGKFNRWLSGTLATEWLVSGPLKDSAGNAHPHLTARFAVRSYLFTNKVRVDVTVENNWAYEPAPQNFVYDAAITVGDRTVFSKPALTHYHHARWRKVFWFGDEPAVHIRHDVPYLLATGALPNYDRTVAVAESALAAISRKFSGAVTEPMGVGMATPYMPQTGGRPDIGILPGWAAAYVLSMDRRAKDATLGTADLAGSWSVHYRNKATDRPVTLLEYPYMTVVAGAYNDSYNPATKKKEAFPACAGAGLCTTPYTHDSSHQPSFAYLPYLVTGDYYYLEELQFWAHWNSFWSNPVYRELTKGLFKTEQVRAQAWSMRTLGQAAFITPEADPQKESFTAMLHANLDWYIANYVDNPGANRLGVLVNGTAVAYEGGTGIAPWMDDFFTAAIGYITDLGFSRAYPLLAYKTRFAIDRMTAPGSCWIDAAKYSMKVRDSTAAPFYPAYAEVYRKSHTAEFNALPCNSTGMAQHLKLKLGEMTGYSAETIGYPSNMQPALAYAAQMGPAGANAWKVFAGRAVKPNYGLSPQFAIVPR